MIKNASDTSALSRASVKELMSWRPPSGVLSVYLNFNPADRGGGWKIELRNSLERARGDADHANHDTRSALERTVARLEREVEDFGSSPPPGLAAFVEIADEAGEERSFASQLPPRRTEAFHGPRPWLGPLIALVDKGLPIGIAAVSAERVRLFNWSFGRVEQLHDWGLELYLDDWRERKAQRPADPARGQAVSSSGRDQYNQRMGANRERFAHDTGALAQVSARERGWRQLLTFGDQRYSHGFGEGFGGVCDVRHVDDSDLVPQPTHLIAERVKPLLPSLRRDRQRTLVERITEAAYAEGRTSFGRQDTMQALEQGRVEHLVYDGRRDGPDIEQMIELAVPTGAAVTVLGDGTAEELDDHGGVVALLRY